MEKKAGKELIDSLITNMSSIANQEEVTEQIAALMAMPDDQFAIIAPGIVEAFVDNISNSADRATIMYLMHQNGIRAQDMVDSMESVYQMIDQIDEYSPNKKDFLKKILAAMCNSFMETERAAERTIQVPIEKVHPDAVIPVYAHDGDSGMDVYALEDIEVLPGETVLVPTGLKVALPVGYELQVRPKSGRALKTKLRVANTPGTIDASYRGEIKIIIENVDPPILDITHDFDEDGKLHITSILKGKPYYISKGEKFAQLVLMEVPKCAFVESTVSEEETDRAAGGFGSTGLN